MTENKDEPAFPNEGFNGWGEPFQGMTLRDYFAAKAMLGLMGMNRAEEFVDENGDEMTYEDGDVGTLFVHTNFLAEEAYMIADMMLKARGS
jgi:hypothetical protein